MKSRETPVLVIGGGQSGLAASYCLKQRGIDHVVLEKNQLGHSWRAARWDSFCLVTPNWQCQLPGFPYRGEAPDGFMAREEIVAYLRDYAQSFSPPLREGVEVVTLCQSDSGAGFEAATSDGHWYSEQVVVATGGYHRGRIPRIAERLPAGIIQLHTSEYRCPERLPDGDVLVVGSGQSGCQIAEDLHLAGRQVHLAVGSAPRAPRLYRGRDVVEWLEEMGYYDIPIDEHPKKDTVRTKTNHYVTGRDGGREIDLRRLALEGMRLYGRLTGISASHLEFGDDLAANLDHADEVAESIKTTIDGYIEKHGLTAPAEPPYQPCWEPGEPVRKLDLAGAGLGSVIWGTGYETDFSWIEIPVFDGSGYPGHHRGVTACAGLYFLGLPWLHTWGSGRFSGVGKDAEFLVERIAARRRVARTAPAEVVNDVAIGS